MDPFTWTEWTKEQLLNRRYDPTTDPRFEDRIDGLKKKYIRHLSGYAEYPLDHLAAVRGCLVEWTSAAAQGSRWVWFWGGLHVEGLRRFTERLDIGKVGGSVRLLARYRNQLDMLPTIEFEPSADVPTALLGLLDTTPLEPYDIVNIEWRGGRSIQIAGALSAFGYSVDEEGLVTLK